jgi:hypothetical protein
VTPRIVVLLTLACVTLAACAAPQQRDATGPTPSRIADPAPVPVAGYTIRPPTPPPTGKPVLENLPGMNAAGITKLIGQPQFRRRDGQVEIWQYRATNCTLDLFLYSEGGDMRVRYAEPRGRTAQPISTSNDAQVRACATALLQSRAGK